MKRAQSTRLKTAAHWLPDWLDPTQYPDPVNTSMKGWAWEFLRRNHDYREIWDHTIYPLTAQKNFNSFGKEADTARQILREKFGLCHHELIPPHYPCSADMPLFFEGSGFRAYHDRSELRESEISVVFDLALPIAPQLAIANHGLQMERQRKAKAGKLRLHDKRLRPERYPIYLRVLDALESGLSLLEVTEMIPIPYTNNTRQSVRDIRKAAEMLRDSDFRYLPFAQTHPFFKK